MKKLPLCGEYLYHNEWPYALQRTNRVGTNDLVLERIGLVHKRSQGKEKLSSHHIANAKGRPCHKNRLQDPYRKSGIAWWIEAQ